MASQNTKDFYNLIHVYLDAVLHPRAVDDPLVCSTMGWMIAWLVCWLVGMLE